MHECEDISPLMTEMQVSRPVTVVAAKGGCTMDPGRLGVLPRGRERVGKIQVEGGTGRLAQAYVTT